MLYIFRPTISLREIYVYTQCIIFPQCECLNGHRPICIYQILPYIEDQQTLIMDHSFYKKTWSFIRNFISEQGFSL
jgi:hypothetical protein